MLKELENGVRIIELGQGTTFISQAIVNDDNDEGISSGIVFSNSPTGMDNNSVIIEITDMKGVMSYVRSICGLLETWNIDGTQEALRLLQDYATQYMGFEIK